MNGARTALAALVAALPRCCACEVATAVVMNVDRWWLCEACWKKVPCSDEPPAHDMRTELAAALKCI